VYSGEEGQELYLDIKGEVSLEDMIQCCVK
jgi:hypothetical protein